jgi:sarcosine oxidase/L-pipecolate oxidase
VIIDANKIIRAAYGTQTGYQALTLEALSAWKSWNSELESGETLPPGFSTADRVFIDNGYLVLNDGAELPPFEVATIASMEEAGYNGTRLVTTDPSHVEIAKVKGLAFAMNPFRRRDKAKKDIGILDTTGGVAVANKACRFALYKAKSLGVKFILDSRAGAFESLCYEYSPSKVTGIKTADGKAHFSPTTILACGGWTPSLLPALDGLCETTAGSVAFLKIPKHSPLFQRFAPENFPSWQYKMRDGADGGLYGFPRDDNGRLKIGYRGTKYTNPVKQADGKERSVPVTRWSSPGESITAIPTHALRLIQAFLDEYLPELGAQGIDITLTRVCWYTDTFDNHFVIDRVPRTEGLIVATGGSGHAFKYLPIIGEWIVDIIEGAGLERLAVKAWRWRKLEKGDTPGNILMEGSKGKRSLSNVALSSDANLKPVWTSKL